MIDILNFLNNYWALIVAFGGVGWVLIKMYFSIKEQKEQLTDLKSQMTHHDDADKIVERNLTFLIDRNKTSAEVSAKVVQDKLEETAAEVREKLEKTAKDLQESTQFTARDVQNKLEKISSDMAVITKMVELIIADKIKVGAAK